MSHAKKLKSANLQISKFSQPFSSMFFTILYSQILQFIYFFPVIKLVKNRPISLPKKRSLPGIKLFTFVVLVHIEFLFIPDLRDRNGAIIVKCENSLLNLDITLPDHLKQDHCSFNSILFAFASLIKSNVGLIVKYAPTPSKLLTWFLLLRHNPLTGCSRCF